MLVAVVVDGFAGAAFEGLDSLFVFLGGRRLFEEVGGAFVGVAGEEGGGGFAAEVAVEAVLGDVKFAGGVVGEARGEGFGGHGDGPAGERR